MTFNRCVHCAAQLPTKGPSEWWCDDTCMQGWTTAQNRAKCVWPTAAAGGSAAAVPLPDLPAAAYPPDAVPLELAPVPRRPGWLDRILGWR